MLLTREQILEVKDILTEDVEVPEWGGTVRVKGITGAERDRYEQSLVEQKGKNTSMNLANARAKLVALSVVDENGKRIFTPADIEALGQKSAGALDRIYTAAKKLSGLSEEDMEELTGNSESGQSGSFTFK